MRHCIVTIALLVCVPALAQEPISQQEFCATDARMSAARSNVNELQREKASEAYQAWQASLFHRPIYDWPSEFSSLARINYLDGQTMRQGFSLAVTRCGPWDVMSNIIPDMPKNRKFLEGLTAGAQLRISGYFLEPSGMWEKKAGLLFTTINGATIER